MDLNPAWQTSCSTVIVSRASTGPGTGDESGLVMIDAGTPQEPVERLLGSERLGQLLGLISERGDWVVIHTSAVLSSADAMWIAPLVDTVLLVVAFWWSQGRRDSRGQDCA